MNDDRFYKNDENDKIWWVITDAKGEFLFTFDKKTIFNMFADYPYKLTDEQVAIFDKENPFWAEFFTDRKK